MSRKRAEELTLYLFMTDAARPVRRSAASATASRRSVCLHLRHGQGHIPSMAQVAEMYLQGVGTPISREEALKWLMAAVRAAWRGAAWPGGASRRDQVGVAQGKTEPEAWTIIKDSLKRTAQVSPERPLVLSPTGPHAD